MRSFRIKICGITNFSDAYVALESGAQAIGLNFFERSRRYVSPAVAARIATDVRQQFPSAVLVGVFVNLDATQLLRIDQLVSLDAIQLHGDETPDITGELASDRIIRAVRMDNNRPLESLGEIQRWQELGVEKFLLDAARIGEYGGTGQSLDWTLIPPIAAASKASIVLAGGLCTENVSEAIRIARPDGVDVASGVESASGSKDHSKIRSFVHAAQAAFETKI